MRPKGLIHFMPKLRWTVTQDAIDLVVIDHRVYDYFKEQLNINSLNQYSVSHLGYATLSQELQESFGKLKNLFREKLRSSIFDFKFDPSNQFDLNHLHRSWVIAHQQYPTVNKLFEPGFLSRINKLIHYIEELTTPFEISTADPYFTMPNIFGTQVLRYGTFNVTVSFNNLGRSSYNKWINGDQVHDTDTNNFNEFYTTLRINTNPSIEQTAPSEYVDWCKRNQMPCVGGIMPLANLDKLEENLLQYRQLFYHNALIENNFITLE